MMPPNISYGCLQRFVQHSPVIVLEKRETVKAGSADAGTVWAGARCSFAKQVKRQLSKGARIAAGGGAAYGPAEDGDDPVQAALEVPIFRGGGVVFGDENHRKTKLGRAAKHECRIHRDGAGNVAPKERGGGRAPEEKPHDDGGHLGVRAGVRQNHRGQGHHRAGREFPDRPARAEDARRGRPKDEAPQARPQEHTLA